MHKSRTFAGILGCCLLVAASAFAHAQAVQQPTFTAPAKSTKAAPPAKPASPAKPAIGSAVPPAQVYGKLLSGMEQEFVSAAEAMPEDKYDFAPATTMGEFKGVRTFAAQVKHVAQANYYFFAGAGYTEAADKANSDRIEKLTTKADIVKALKDSFVMAHAFTGGITAANAFTQTTHGTRGGMAAFGMAHLMDHYGQMVEYLRMNGIVPPASRGGSM